MPWYVKFSLYWLVSLIVALFVWALIKALLFVFMIGCIVITCVALGILLTWVEEEL